MKFSIPQQINRGRLIYFLVFLAIIFTVGSISKVFYINWMVGFVLIFTWIANLAYNRILPRYLAYAILLQFLWLIYSILIIPWTEHTMVHLKGLAITLFYNTVAFIIGDYILRNKETFAKIYTRVAILWILTNGLVLLIIIIAPDLELGKFSGIYANRNEFAITTTIFLSAPVFMHISSRKWKAALLILLGVILILVTQSIKGIIGLVLIFVLYINYSTRKNYVIITFFVLALGFFLLMFTNNPIRERMDTFSSLFKEDTELGIGESAYKRYELSQQSFRLIRNKPLFGYGINNSTQYLKTTRKLQREKEGIAEETIGTYSHNNFLEMIINGGFVALLLYYLPLFFSLLYINRKLKKQSGTRYHRYILVLLYLKLFFDLGMVSYHSFIHCILVSLVLITYAKVWAGSKELFEEA